MKCAVAICALCLLLTVSRVSLQSLIVVFTGHTHLLFDSRYNSLGCTILPAKSDSDVVLWLQLLSKTLTYGRAKTSEN